MITILISEDLFSPLQPPLNAQMLAQRQRELYSQQHRQRQLIQQQRAMLMRQQSFGNNLPPSSGLPVQMGNPRLPQGAPQQFPYPPNYGTNPGTPPASTSPFSQLAANPESTLANRNSMVNRGMTGNMGGQFGAGINPQMQQNVFQYPGSGMRITPLRYFISKRTGSGVSVQQRWGSVPRRKDADMGVRRSRLQTHLLPLVVKWRLITH